MLNISEDINNIIYEYTNFFLLIMNLYRINSMTLLRADLFGRISMFFTILEKSNVIKIMSILRNGKEKILTLLDCTAQQDSWKLFEQPILCTKISQHRPLITKSTNLNNNKNTSGPPIVKRVKFREAALAWSVFQVWYVRGVAPLQTEICFLPDTHAHFFMFFQSINFFRYEIGTAMLYSPISG